MTADGSPSIAKVELGPSSLGGEPGCLYFEIEQPDAGASGGSARVLVSMGSATFIESAPGNSAPPAPCVLTVVSVDGEAVTLAATVSYRHDVSRHCRGNSNCCDRSSLESLGTRWFDPPVQTVTFGARRDLDGGDGTRGPIATDGGTDAPVLNANGDCVVSTAVPDSAAGCRLNYDDEVSVMCRLGYPPRGTTCGDYLVLVETEAESASACYYDARTRRLVATHFCSDINQYCDSQAWCAWRGPDVGSCYVANLGSVSTPVCPTRDGGP